MSWLDDLTSFAVTRLDDRVREALAARGVSDEQIDLYQIGYLNRELPPLSYPKLFLKQTYNGQKLDDMYVFPLTNVLGAVRGLQFRHVERDKKDYIDYIDDKSEVALFGLSQAMPHVWETGSILLVEGTFDLFPVQRPVPQTVATLTARVVEPLIPVLRRLVDDIWIGYDRDATGMRATANFIRGYGSEFRIHEVAYPTPLMPNGKRAKDPGDLWELWGDEKLVAFFHSVLGTENPIGG